VTFSTEPAGVGSLTAVVTTDGVSSAAPVQVATVIPVVTKNTTYLGSNATTITINGFGFDPSAGNNTVTFNDNAVGTVTTASATSLTVTFSTEPASLGSLTAVVTTDSLSSGAPVQVATVAPVDFAAVFSGPNSPTLGTNWEVPPLLPALLYTYRRRIFDGFQLQNNAAVSPAAPPFIQSAGSPAAQPATVSEVTGQSLLNPTVEAAVNVGAAQAVGVAARVQANGDAYVAALTSNGTAEILLYSAAHNTYTVLGATGPGGPTAALLQFVVSGSALSLYVNSIQVVSVPIPIPAISTAGGVGLFALGADGIVSDFSVTGS